MSNLNWLEQFKFEWLKLENAAWDLTYESNKTQKSKVSLPNSGRNEMIE